MHFSANASDINAGMSLVGHALSARPTRAIFEGVLIETVDNGICLTCTDGEMIIRTRVNAMVVDEGVAIMPAKLFGELIRKLSGEVDVEIDKKFRAEVRAQGSNTSIQGTDASEFPDVPDVRGEFQISLPQNRLRDAVSRIMFAISTDETRRILTGCLMEVSPTEARFVGLDGLPPGAAAHSGRVSAARGQGQPGRRGARPASWASSAACWATPRRRPPSPAARRA